MKKIICLFIIITAFSCSKPSPNDNPSNDSPSSDSPSIGMDATKPDTIHSRVLTLDSHIDISFDFATSLQDPLQADIQANLEKMQIGGLDSAFFIVYVGQAERTQENYATAQAAALTKFLAIRRMAFELYPERVGLAYSPSDVENIVAQEKIAAIIGIENGFVMGRDLSLLDKYYDLGARYMTLVHNGHNDLGDSAQPREQLGDGETEHGGLSELGIATVKRMNELGMMVDISHAAKQTALDVINASTASVIASHSGVRALTDHPRNLDDETLDALKANGGVVQIVAYNAYLKITPPGFLEARRALNTLYGFEGRPELDKLDETLRAQYQQELAALNQQYPGADVDDLVDHIDYAVKRIGIDHVGISSDFGGGGGVIGWQDASETANVTAELVDRGYSEQDIQKLWGGNLLRVWRQIEQVAQGD